MTQEEMDYGLPYMVRCPECLADRGAACIKTLANGELRNWPHIARGELANKIFPVTRRQPMTDPAQVLQSRHDTELAEYKKAMGPVTKKEWKVYRFGASVTVNERGFGDWLMAYRRALLEKKPDPIDPLHGLTSKYMPETTKAIGLSLHDELIAEAFNRGRSEPRA